MSMLTREPPLGAALHVAPVHFEKAVAMPFMASSRPT